MKRRNNKSTFSGILREYLSQSQVQGYKLIVQTDRPLYERVIWILITIFGILITFWFVINSYFEFLVSPTVTSEDPIRTSVLELSFPAVSVCNSNRISRRALMKYSEFILNATKNQNQNLGRSVDEVFTNLVQMGQMYTMDLDDDDNYKMDLIHTVLSRVYGGSYPIYEIISTLAPNCSDLLKACKWQGHYEQCSKIFITRKTYMGPCCVFNYQRPVVSILKTQQQFNHTIPKFEKPQQVNSHGSDFGLTFLIDHQLNDYVFTMNSFTGMLVLIHDAYDFPDQTTGAVKEKIVSPQQEVFITLHPTLINGSRSMKTFTVSSRNCVFNDEINLVFSNFYSLSECLLTCRISNIIQFCGCTPPQFTNLFNASDCLFNDLACLNRWRLNWYNYETAASVAGDLDINDYHCPECVPKCSGIKYLVHTSEANFDPQETKKRSHDPTFINFTDISNHSIIYINFGTNKVTNYDQTASYVWYELLGTYIQTKKPTVAFTNLGAVGCLSLGASVVSIIEILYFSGKFGVIGFREHFPNVGKNKSKFDYVN